VLVAGIVMAGWTAMIAVAGGERVAIVSHSKNRVD
jgi:hypothetical protein